MTEQLKPVPLFWTGGFDSTFRLAQLLLLYRKPVQPYYILDHGRNSTVQELKAMNSIKKLIFEKSPESKNLLQATKFKALDEIRENKGITDSYMRLVQQESIGIQYEWLARFCAELGIEGMEISLETAIHEADNRTRKLLGNDLDRFETDTGVCYRLNPGAEGMDKYAVYGRLKFPAYDFTKAGKYAYACEHRFDDILRLTWFCHMPARNSKPCGKCHPCRAVYREGLKWRLPLSAKVRYHTWPVLRKAAGLLHLYKP